MHSGVATMSKELVLGTIHKYDWLQLGAAINHPDVGKGFLDLSEDVRKTTGIKDANLKILPYNGYGDMNIIRQLIEIEKPDAILHFTDPHYWRWLYDGEHEIRQQIPLMFYHVWDCIPPPRYNANFYASCDSIFCISKLTYGIVYNVINTSVHKGNVNPYISYVPHGINQNIFKPLDRVGDNVYNSINGNKKYDFVLFYNNRNIRRKQPSDVIHSFRLFCDQLPKEQSDKCMLLMHTAPVDENGTDLPAVINVMCPNYDVKFTHGPISQEQLNEYYNIVDCTINIANNEGFGLTSAESIMAGTPVILNVTGGLQDQCGFDYTEDDYVEIGSLNTTKGISHGEWSQPVWPSALSINGSVVTPYIFEDRVNNNDVSDAIMKIYKLSKEERKQRGLKGREWMIKNLSDKVMCEKMITGIDTTLENFTPRKKFELHKII
jgi:glycosyltransferase involved in cell wall biosynthesis